jgi:hypothetical protein
MTNGDRNRWAWSLGVVIAGLLGLLGFVTLGSQVLVYMVDIGAEVMVAVIGAVAPALN